MSFRQLDSVSKSYLLESGIVTYSLVFRCADSSRSCLQIDFSQRILDHIFAHRS
ncbi:hypothetical protein JMJ77_0000388 [Colletotrichum scovillei]|uniref:Uncharacterized protein n=1 Tax=Colletotrichum scovillei TaxID=1209932 RepID=A0A9P7R9F0_9PEZI|nr:hypothetical protein JMJ77_0000388 [Colletotrichum scovillei]KAG7071594.1 hypothetical protein JMJ76_0004465 [Colletotrichum scovillei]KAG7079873.1 hypothetical protein JMJ78_0006977 [Colletotrichum scovillei]